MVTNYISLFYFYLNLIFITRKQKNYKYIFIFKIDDYSSTQEIMLFLEILLSY